MRYLLPGVMLLLPQLLPAQADEIKQINWAINTAPPFHIVGGDYKQQGLCDVLIDTVHRYLPELRKQREVLPQPRIGRALERAENLCFPCMIHKQHGEQGAYYSMPTHIYLPHQIIANSKAAQRISEKYPLPVSLAELLADDEFHFGYPAGRRFGVLQGLIEGQDNRPGNRLVRSGDNGPEAILQMIDAQRLDYTIDYSIIRRYHQLSTGQLLQLLPIAENHQKLVHGAIGCTNNAWGRSIIDKINQVMPQIRNDAEFSQNQDLWFEHHPQYRQLNKRALATIKP